MKAKQLLHSILTGMNTSYKKTDGTALVYCDSEAKAEEHFKEYEFASVRIAAEEEIYYYRSEGCPLVEL